MNLYYCQPILGMFLCCSFGILLTIPSRTRAPVRCRRSGSIKDSNAVTSWVSNTRIPLCNLTPPTRQLRNRPTPAVAPRRPNPQTTIPLRPDDSIRDTYNWPGHHKIINCFRNHLLFCGYRFRHTPGEYLVAALINLITYHRHSQGSNSSDRRACAASASSFIHRDRFLRTAYGCPVCPSALGYHHTVFVLSKHLLDGCWR